MDTGEPIVDGERAPSAPLDRAAHHEALFRSLLPAIALLAAAVRATYAIGWRFDRGLLYDGPVYRNRAEFLLSGRRFLDPDAWVFREQAAQGAIHPPGNVLWLALGRQLGIPADEGLQLWGGLLGVATVIVIGLAGRAIAGPRVGLIAAGIAAIHPGLWSFDPMVMAESPGQFATAIVLLLAYRFWDDPSPSRAAWLGGAAAAAALVRSELLVYLPLLVLPLTLASRGTGRQALLRLGSAVLWSAMVLGPWVGWNLVRFDHPVTLATGLDISLAYAQCDETWYGRDTGYWNVFCGADIPKDPANEFADESEIGQQYRERAGEYIADNLDRWPTVIAARVGRTLSLWGPLDQVEIEANREGRERSVLLAALTATAITVVLAAVAFVRPPRSRRHLLPLLVPLFAGVAGAAITFGTTRYRSAGEVGLILLAAVGIDALLRLRRREREGDAPSGPHHPEGYDPDRSPDPELAAS